MLYLRAVQMLFRALFKFRMNLIIFPDHQVGMIFQISKQRKIALPVREIIALTAALLLIAASAFSQVLPASGVKNTLSTSFGLPYDSADNSDRCGVRLYGLLETLQVRYDIKQFTMEGMLNWGALTWWDAKGGFDNFTFENTGITR